MYEHIVCISWQLRYAFLVWGSPLGEQGEAWLARNPTAQETAQVTAKIARQKQRAEDAKGKTTKGKATGGMPRTTHVPTPPSHNPPQHLLDSARAKEATARYVAFAAAKANAAAAAAMANATAATNNAAAAAQVVPPPPPTFGQAAQMGPGGALFAPLFGMAPFGQPQAGRGIFVAPPPKAPGMLNTTIGLQLLRDAEQVAIPAPPFPTPMGFLDGINLGICLGKQEQEIAMLRNRLEDKDRQVALQLQAEEHAAAADDDSRPTCYTIFTCIHPLYCTCIHTGVINNSLLPGCSLLIRSRAPLLTIPCMFNPARQLQLPRGHGLAD